MKYFSILTPINQYKPEQVIEEKKEEEEDKKEEEKDEKKDENDEN